MHAQKSVINQINCMQYGASAARRKDRPTKRFCFFFDPWVGARLRPLHGYLILWPDVDDNRAKVGHCARIGTWGGDGWRLLPDGRHGAVRGRTA